MDTQHLITLDHAGAGMILAKDLLDSRGNILVPAKAVLTENLIASLRRHHVEEIAVLAEAADADLPEPAEQFDLAEKLARIDAMFQPHEDEAINMQLKNYVINFFTASHHGKN